MAISTLDEYLTTVSDANNHTRMVKVSNWGCALPGAGAAHHVEPAAVPLPRDTHHRVLGHVQAHRFEPVMRERGTDFVTVVARQPWNKPFNYELLDAFFQHQLEDKCDITSFWRPQS